MRKITLLKLVFLLLPLWANSQNSPIRNLALNITKGINDDSLKVVAIYTWIFENIEYDWDTYFKLISGLPYTMEAWTVKDILRTNKAVCGGYAYLFKDLCNLNKIEAAYIIGKTLNENHAWNGVKIRNRWYLMDITWADNIDKKPVADVDPKIEFERDSFLMSLVSKEVQESLKKPPSEQEENLLAFIESVKLTKEELDSLKLESYKNSQLTVSTNPYLWDNGVNMIKEHIPRDPIWQLLDKPKSLDCLKTVDCLLEDSYPNYGNQINEEMKLDSISQVYRSIERAFKYAPDDEWAIYNAAYFFTKRGDDTYQVFLKQKNLKYDATKLNPLKEKAIKYYEISNSFYEKLKPFKEFEFVTRTNIAYNVAFISLIKSYKID